MNDSMLEKLNNNEWIDISDACEILNLSIKTIKRYCNNGKLVYKIFINKNGKNYFIASSSILERRKCYLQDKSSAAQKSYSNAPQWAKAQEEKYLPIIEDTLNLRSVRLKEYINTWNLSNPNNTFSCSSVIRMRRRYYEFGGSGLLSKHGTNKTRVPDDYFDYFKKLYLKEGGPSIRSCWELTFGHAILEDCIDKTKFPSHMSFARKLYKEVPEQAIYIARHGETAWNRNFSNYIKRDYANAWVFNALNDEFIGKTKVVKAVAALHADKISKEEFKEAMSIKKRNKKITQSYIENSRDISAEEKYENYK